MLIFFRNPAEIEPTDPGISAFDYDEQVVVDHPAIAFPIPPAGAGTNVPPNTGPDAGNTTELVIPLLLTGYTPAHRSPKVTPVPLIPMIVESTNMVMGANTLSDGGKELAKMTLQGHIDTPTVNQGGYQVPAFTLGGVQYHYADYIAACMEGRGLTFLGIWISQQPYWFRDPFGRKFNNPRMLDFTANYVEAVPGRTNFTMQLFIAGGSGYAT